MSPEERQLLQGLFDRMRGSGSAPRDHEAEQMISDQVRQQPYSPYLLAQTVIVQDQALQAANDRLQQLERQVQEHQSQGSGGGSFLGGLFGGGAPKSSVPATQPPPLQQRPSWNQGGTGYPPPPQQSYPQQQGYAPPPPGGGGPWGSAMGGGGMAGSGGFLKGALGTAAGVAGGVLMADGIRNLFSSGHAGGGLGIGAGVPGVGAGATTVNNYYGDSGQLADADRTQDALQDQNDNFQPQHDAPTAADWQQDADQDQDDAQDAGWSDDDFS